MTDLGELSRQYQAALEYERAAVEALGEQVSAEDLLDEIREDSRQAFAVLERAWLDRLIAA